jgi:hypothetical protein
MRERIYKSIFEPEALHEFEGSAAAPADLVLRSEGRAAFRALIALQAAALADLLAFLQ